MTLEEKGLQYKTIEEDLRAPSAELLRLHPQGKVPLLLHDGVAIHESSVITEYLEDLFPDPTLMPQSPLGRAQMRLWTFWVNELFKPDLDSFKYKWEKLSEAEKANLLERLRAHLQKLELTLAENEFLLGTQFTLADIHVFPFYRQFEKAHANFANLFQPKFARAWLERITARDSFARVMRKNLVS